MSIRPVFIFDLDGTLVDSVYEHVLAWQEALNAEGIELSVWRIHRKIGMSGGLFTNQLLRETKMDITPERIERLGRLHAAAYQKFRGKIRPLPGARAALSRPASPPHRYRAGRSRSPRGGPLRDQRPLALDGQHRFAVRPRESAQGLSMP